MDKLLSSPQRRGQDSAFPLSFGMVGQVAPGACIGMADPCQQCGGSVVGFIQDEKKKKTEVKS